MPYKSPPLKRPKRFGLLCKFSLFQLFMQINLETHRNKIL
jgi:hypothetical protein